jgi:hypothetical protein
MCGTRFKDETDMTSLVKFIFLVSAALAVMCQTASAAPCWKDGSDSETAVGRLVIGKPVQLSGSASRPFILILSAPACLNATDPKESVRRQGTVHVFSSDNAVTAQFPALVGKSVTVRGRAMLRHTRFHRTPIIMDVVAMRPL